MQGLICEISGAGFGFLACGRLRCQITFGWNLHFTAMVAIFVNPAYMTSCDLKQSFVTLVEIIDNPLIIFPLITKHISSCAEVFDVLV